MSILTFVPGSSPPDPVGRLTVEGYHGMIRAGLLTEDDAIELIEGWIVPKMPHNPKHDGTVQRVHKVLRRALPSGWDIRVQSAITLEDSEPEPDLAVVEDDASDYLDRHPGPAQTALVIEVAESSLAQDEGSKLRTYARAGIRCYWIINLVDNRVEVYNAPTGPTEDPKYAQRQDFSPVGAIPFVVEGRDRGPIAAADLLPR